MCREYRTERDREAARKVVASYDPICIHNRSTEHIITILLTDGSSVDIPPLHAADVTQRFSRFVTAVVLTPMDIEKRYGEG
jgi:hypothetical protein